ncbi:response regulator [Pseudomonas marginalis]|uniref:response regulator n=1 Tax=Pseudomonas marginalis TaxID=298 RepID=UPI003BA286B4
MQTALIVDDHPFIRMTGKLLLEQELFIVVGEADNGVDAVQLAALHSPSLIMLDISIPKLDGLEVLKRVNALKLPSKVLVLSSQPAKHYALRCMKAGAAGYISKNDDPNELVKAVRTIKSGYKFFPELAQLSTRPVDVENAEFQLVKGLSGRELMVLQRLAQGMTNKDICEEMALSDNAVHACKVRLFEKLNIKSLVYLADFAKRNKLV